MHSPHPPQYDTGSHEVMACPPCMQEYDTAGMIQKEGVTSMEKPSFTFPMGSTRERQAHYLLHLSTIIYISTLQYVQNPHMERRDAHSHRQLGQQSLSLNKQMNQNPASIGVGEGLVG